MQYNVDKEIWAVATAEVNKAKSQNDSESLQIFDAGIKWIHVNESRKYEKCSTSTLVAVIKANGDIPLCVLKRNNSNNIVGNIYNGGFVKNWFSDWHMQLVENIDVEMCQKPCKHDAYNIVSEALSSDMYHINFV